MVSDKKYEISFSGLKDGVHTFDFEFDMDVFKESNPNELKDCALNANLKLEKSPTVMVIDFLISGNVETDCDRCLRNLSIPVTVDEKLYVKFGDEFGQESEDVVILPRTAHRINLKQYVYEYVTLAIPQKTVHEEAECDPVVLEQIQALSTHEEIESDPRWSKLDELKQQ